MKQKFKIKTVNKYPAKNTYKNDDVHELYDSILNKKGKIIKIEFKNDRDKENFRMILNNNRRAGKFSYPFCKKENAVFIDMRIKSPSFLKIFSENR